MKNLLMKLAEKRYQLYRSLFEYQSYTNSKEESFKQLEERIEYNLIMEIIGSMPFEEREQYDAIENKYFVDAPYVRKH